jgi:hypothetical protein
VASSSPNGAREDTCPFGDMRDERLGVQRLLEERAMAMRVSLSSVSGCGRGALCILGP